MQENKPPLGVLTSFWYYKTFDFSLIPKEVPLLLDSGAFSAFTQGKEVSIPQFAEWVKNMPRPYEFAFNMDELGNPQQSLKNWERLVSMGIDTAPVTHFGDRPEKVLPPYVEQGAEVIALGGLAVSGAGKQTQAWSAHVLRWLQANAPHVRTHGLGVSQSSPLARLPFTTVDSSAPTSAWRFARLRIWNPIKRRWQVVHLNGLEPYKEVELLAAYGVKPSEVLKSSPHTREVLVRLVCRSEYEAAVTYRKRQAKQQRTSYLVDANKVNLEQMSREALELNEGRTSFLADTSTTNMRAAGKEIGNLRTSYMAAAGKAEMKIFIDQTERLINE